MRRVVIIAGEASGDLLGAGLIRALRERDEQIVFEGIAGPLMTAAGCRAWRAADELAVMGLAEVLRHLPRILRIIRETRARLLADPPDLLIAIDAPDFNLRIEPAARAAGIKTIHYVSPSVWAWRQARVKTLKQACDCVLCLLPFEADFLQRHGVPAQFVGHPLADEIPVESDPQLARATLELAAVDGPVVSLLPGSRAGEVSRLAPDFARTANWLSKRVPRLQFIVPLAHPGLAAVVEQAMQRFAPDCRWRAFNGRAREVIAAGDAVLLTSGTASLETMLVNRPMVVAYRAAPMTYFIVRGLGLVKAEYFSLPNLLANRRLVPEFLQYEISAEVLGQALLDVMLPGERQAQRQQEFAALGGQLRRGASQRAAEVACALLNSE